MIETEAILEQDHDGRSQCAPDDASLLERFAVAGEEAAFALLVRRHGAAVMRVCRSVLRDEHDAEDAFQSTFLVLARKAGTLAWHESVGAWLTAVAQRLARNLRARRERRRERPSPSASEPLTRDDPVAEVARRELRTILERELHELPEKYRDPVVLCYLEGKTHEEAARTLGWPRGSMSRRLSRARALLQQRLRGLMIATSILGAVAATLWVLAQQPRRQTGTFDRQQVASRMAPFKSIDAGGRGLEDTLKALARQDRPTLSEHQIDEAVAETERLARWLEDVDADRDRATWQRHAGAMRLSAHELSQAIRVPDMSVRSRAARKLLDTCRRCHETFGE